MKDLIIEDADNKEERQPDMNLPTITTEQIMMRAVENGNVDALERIIALKNAEEERNARIEFEECFADMQKDFTPIRRGKENKGTSSKYAPLDMLQKHFGPIIARHGFSYRWDEENSEHGKKTTIYITGHGHTKQNSFFVPQLEGTRAMNAVQVAAAMSTYGQRYTFVAGFGITIEGEDVDGNIAGDAALGSPEDFLRVQLDRIDKIRGIDDGYRASLRKEVNDAFDSKNPDKAEAARLAIQEAERGN